MLHEMPPGKHVRVYNYGALPPGGQDRTLAEDQMRLAHRYRNDLCRLELDRRQQAEDVLRRLVPELSALEDQVRTAEEDLERCLSVVKQANTQERRQAASPADRQAVRAARESLRELRARHRLARREAFARPTLRGALDQVDEAAKAEQKRLRADCGLYWGSYLVQEAAASSFRKGPPPRFRSWTGDGHLAVQLQKGLTVPELFACTDTRLRVKPIPDSAWGPGRHTRERQTVLWFRVGSESGKPVWCQVPFLMHRPMPEGCIIKWCHLLRRKIATRERWSVQFVVEMAAVDRPSDQSLTGTMGLDLGWRLLPDGSLRVAYWASDAAVPTLSEVRSAGLEKYMHVSAEGSFGPSEGQLVLPPELVGRWTRTETLRSTRDQNFNQARAQLVDWLAQQGPGVPDWLARWPGIASLGQWRSPGRLARLVYAWRDNRLPGDEAIHAILETWRRQDAHLYDWESFNLRRAIKTRSCLYLNFVALLRRTYRTVVLEDVDWSDLARRPQEEDPDTIAASRAQRRIASVGRLALLLAQGMAETVRVDPAYTTLKCHACGLVCAFDAARDLDHTCEHCGLTWDQDANGARNLLASAASGEAVAISP